MENVNGDLQEIKEKLEEVHRDVKRLGQCRFEGIFQGKREMAVVLHQHLLENAEEALEREMVKPCKMYLQCKNLFLEGLQEHLSLLDKDKVSGEDIEKIYSKFQKQREGAPFKECATCFNEVYSLLDKQSRIIRSLRIYRHKDSSLEIPDAEEVAGDLMAIANRQRLQILNAVTRESMSFSQLSELTGLRGGNLLFHLQKLLERGLILQRHGRGDYMITEKGYEMIKLISEAYTRLSQQASP